MSNPPMQRFASHFFSNCLDLITIALVLSLACCSNGPSKDEITKALNANLAQHDPCFALEQMGGSITWPLRINDNFGLAPLPPIVLVMANAHYVRIEKPLPQGFQPPPIVIYPTEEAKTWWDSKTGWCGGHSVVADIGDIVSPDKASGQPTVVNFAWHLVQVPEWARRPEFAVIPGMQRPVAGKAYFVQTNNGWKLQGVATSS